MTLSELLDSAHANSLLVNNLFQRDDGTWQANVRDAKLAFDFGTGRSPEDALASAISNALAGGWRAVHRRGLSWGNGPFGSPCANRETSQENRLRINSLGRGLAMMTLADKLRSYVTDLKTAAAAGDRGAKQVIDLYQLHVACPSDPGAPALCEAAFDDWLKGRTA